MIKLINIIKEIKITGNITPEMVFNLTTKLWDFAHRVDDYDTGYDLDGKVDRCWDNNGYRDGDGKYEDFVKTLDKNQLKNLYNDLLQLQNKYNINEIKVRAPKKKLELILNNSSLFTKKKIKNDYEGEYAVGMYPKENEYIAEFFEEEGYEDRKQFEEYLKYEHIPYRVINKLMIAINKNNTIIEKI